MLAAIAPLALAQNQTFTYTYGGLSVPIYPDDWDTIGVATILVPRSISISKVTAAVQVQYSGVGDLNVYLYSSNGTRTKLLERSCGGLVNIDTTFDDSAAAKYSDTCPAEAGRGPFRGNEPLSNANGQNAYGYWRLAIENNGSSRSGVVTGFSVTITGTPLGTPAIGAATIVSASSFQSGAIAPGDTIGILGVNLGPTTGVRADAKQTLPTSLGQTSVTFDGQPVPLFYVSERLVTVHAPANLTAGNMTRIQVISSAGSSPTVSLNVAAVNPGVFTYESGGQGQAKAVNQDGSLNGDGTGNSSQTGAARGSVISVYASGLGVVNPQVASGSVPPGSPLSPTASTVTASIGGRPATVLFAGAAPGQTGIYQVNIMVPTTVVAGTARLVLTAEGKSSQDNVTLQIK